MRWYELDAMVEKWMDDPSGPMPCPGKLSQSSYSITSLSRNIVDPDLQQFLVAYMLYYQQYINECAPLNSCSDYEIKTYLLNYSPNAEITRLRLDLWSFLK